MELKDNLTNEAISKRFDNQFDLVTHSIKLVANMIRTGRSPRVKTKTENPALQVLEEILEGKDAFEELSSKKEKEMTTTADWNEKKALEKEIPKSHETTVAE